jgi:protein TonB
MIATGYREFDAHQNARFAICFAITLAVHACLGLALLLKEPPASPIDSQGPTVLIELAPISASQADVTSDVAERRPANDAESQKEQSDAERAVERSRETPPEPVDDKVENIEQVREPTLQLALQPLPDVEGLQIDLPPQQSEAEMPPPGRDIVRPEPEPKPERRKPPEKAKTDIKVEKARKKTAAVPERAPDDTRRVATRNVAALSDNAQRPTEARTAGGVSAAAAQSAAAAMANWQRRLSAHLEARKRYPAEAAAGNERGVAYVRFSLDRQGRVLASGLARSSGSAALDRETLDLVRRAQPMPAPPAEDKRSRFDIAVPIHFNGR